MNKYLFNAEYTIEVTAPDEETARETFWIEAYEYSMFNEDVYVDVIESDIMLVEVQES